LGFDPEVVVDPTAPPVWARFYEFGTNVPIFTGRDGVVRYALREIEAERRGGYMWYTDDPAKLLENDYPKWRKRLGLP
jgi:PelA/Pel-15E family pectate lyase